MQMLVKAIASSSESTLKPAHKARNIRTDSRLPWPQPAIVESFFSLSPISRFQLARLGIDRLGAALYVDDIDRLEDIQQRRPSASRASVRRAAANHQRRCGATSASRVLRATHLDIAQAGGGQCGYMPAKPAPIMTSPFDSLLAEWIDEGSGRDERGQFGVHDTGMGRAHSCGRPW